MKNNYIFINEKKEQPLSFKKAIDPKSKKRDNLLAIKTKQNNE